MIHSDGIVADVLWISALHIILGGGYFLRAGGRTFLFSGGFTLAGAVFFGFPGIVLALLDPHSLSDASRLTSMAGLAGTLSAMVVASPMRRHVSTAAHGDVPPATLPPSWGYLRGLLFLGAIATFVGARLGLALGALPEVAAYVATLICFCEVIVLRATSRREALVAAGRWLMVATIFVLAFFDGGGRLRLATLIYSHAIIAAAFGTRAELKTLAALGLVPAMVFFGILRGQSGDLGTVLATAEGLDSMITPYETCAELMRQMTAGNFAPRGAADFVTTLLFWIPRSVWPDKPFGFGYVLTLHFRPELAHVGHSMAATYLGEFYACARWIAVACGIPLVSILLGLGDRAILAVSRRGGRGQTVRLVVLAILAAGVFDYVWVGTFTFFSRNILRIGYLMVVSAAAATLAGMVTERLRTPAGGP